MQKICTLWVLYTVRSQTIDDGFCKYDRMDKMVPTESKRNLIATSFGITFSVNNYVDKIIEFNIQTS